MLVKGTRKVAVVLPVALILVLILLIYYANGQIPLLPHGHDAIEDASDHSSGNSRPEPEHGETPLITFPNENGIGETHNEVFSVSTNDKRYFAIDFGEEAMNPSIIPHPVLAETWIIVAQQGRSDLQPGSTWYSELVCDARFQNGKLTCVKPPKILPIAATSGDKCVGDLDYFALNIGPHDARVFYGPESPYIIYGSNSAYTCLGQWVQDFRMLVDWGGFQTGRTTEEYTFATDLQRPAPYGIMEKNWFVFWDTEGKSYAHYDIYPRRVFARLELDGSAGQDLAPAAAYNDEKCLAKYLPSVAETLESIHQATNSLSITLCQRADPSCDPDDSNTYIFTIFQHKSFYYFHSVYEPYVMLFKRKAPFEIFGISSKPIWIHGRGKASPPKELDLQQLEDWNQTEMFYVTSMSWKMHGQRYHGFVDDVLFIGFGIEDQRTAGIDVVAGDLLRDLGLCSLT